MGSENMSNLSGYMRVEHWPWVIRDGSWDKLTGRYPTAEPLRFAFACWIVTSVGFESIAGWQQSWKTGCGTRQAADRPTDPENRTQRGADFLSHRTKAEQSNLGSSPSKRDPNFATLTSIIRATSQLPRLWDEAHAGIHHREDTRCRRSADVPCRDTERLVRIQGSQP